jgi:hypothetical protein
MLLNQCIGMNEMACQLYSLPEILFQPFILVCVISDLDGYSTGIRRPLKTH